MDFKQNSRGAWILLTTVTRRLWFVRSWETWYVSCSWTHLVPAAVPGGRTPRVLKGWVPVYTRLVRPYSAVRILGRFRPGPCTHAETGSARASLFQMWSPACLSLTALQTFFCSQLFETHFPVKELSIHWRTWSSLSDFLTSENICFNFN